MCSTRRMSVILDGGNADACYLFIFIFLWGLEVVKMGELGVRWVGEPHFTPATLFLIDWYDIQMMRSNAGAYLGSRNRRALPLLAD